MKLNKEKHYKIQIKVIIANMISSFLLVSLKQKLIAVHFSLIPEESRDHCDLQFKGHITNTG